MTPTTDTTPATEKDKELWKNYTSEQRQTVEEIAQWQASVNLSDEGFVAGCGTMSMQTWYQLRTGRYGARDCSRMVNIAKRHAIERRKTWTKSQSLTSTPTPFIETAKFHEVLEAVESAMTAAEIGDDDKILWIIGKSGFGKTEIARQLVARKGASLVTASESWRDGLLDALTDFAAALDIPQPTNSAKQPKAWSSKGAAERAILSKLKTAPRILCINEVEFFSNRVLNILRRIADETETVIVIFCVPDFYNDILRQGGAHAHQLRTRTEGVVWLDKVEKSEAAKLLGHYWPNKDHKEAAGLMASFANDFGGWRVLKRITRHLRGNFPQASTPPSVADVSAAITLQRDYQEAA